jgi:hypothetical protein
LHFSNSNQNSNWRHTSTRVASYVVDGNVQFTMEAREPNVVIDLVSEESSVTDKDMTRVLVFNMNRPNGTKQSLHSEYKHISGGLLFTRKDPNVDVKLTTCGK